MEKCLSQLCQRLLQWTEEVDLAKQKTAHQLSLLTMSPHQVGPKGPKGPKEVQVAFLQDKLNRLNEFDTVGFLSQLNQLVPTVDSVVGLLKQHGLIGLLKDVSPFHDVLSQGLKTTPLILACSCSPTDATVLKYWVKLDQSNFCSTCGQLQEPSFWVQPLGLSQLSVPKDLNVVTVTNSVKEVKWLADFSATLLQFQGKANDAYRVPDKVFTDVVNTLKQEGVIVQANHPSQRFSQVTPDHVFQALEKHVKYGDTAYFVFYKLTGKLAHSFTPAEEAALYSDFQDVVRAFAETTNTLKTFLHPLYLLHQLLRLRLRTVPLLAPFFPITALKTPNKQGQQDQLCKTLFTHLSWDFSPLFSE